MKNSEEKYFLYLKGKMKPAERVVFEDELNKSELLKKDFEEYKGLQNLITETMGLKVKQEYSKGIVAQFRKRLEVVNEKKSYKNIKYAFASLLVVVASYIVVSIVSGNGEPELNQILADLSDDEINIIANDFYLSEDMTKSLDDMSSQKIYSIYTENLKSGIEESIGELNSSALLNQYNVTDFDKYLLDTDIDVIYSQLIEKKIL